jgi:hypothetical protein
MKRLLTLAKFFRSHGADRVVRLWELDLGPIPLGQLHK